MKRALYIALLVGSFVVGVGAVLWPAFEAVESAFQGAGRRPGEYAGDHDCPAGQTPIEVVQAFSETFGGTNATGTRTSLWCEDAAGNRTNVTQAELEDETSSIVRKVIISIVVSLIAWAVFAVTIMAGTRSVLTGLLRGARFGPQRQTRSVIVDASGAQGADLSSLDPETARQVRGVLESLGFDAPATSPGPATATPTPEGMGYATGEEGTSATHGRQQDATAPRRTVAQRLRELSDLRDAGLITREEYEEQRRAIVQSLGEA